MFLSNSAVLPGPVCIHVYMYMSIALNLLHVGCSVRPYLHAKFSSFSVTSGSVHLVCTLCILLACLQQVPLHVPLGYLLPSACAPWAFVALVLCVPPGLLLSCVCPLAYSLCAPWPFAPSACAPWPFATLCVPPGLLLPSVCPLTFCYPLCAPWPFVTLCVCPQAFCYPLYMCAPDLLLPSVCPLAFCYPLSVPLGFLLPSVCAPWPTLCVPLGLPSVCPLTFCYPLRVPHGLLLPSVCAPWPFVTLCVPLGCLEFKVDFAISPCTVQAFHCLYGTYV